MKNLIRLLVVSLIFIISTQTFAVDSGLKKTQHAGAADGLTRIDKDGVYIYDTKNELKNESSHIRVGSADHPEITVQVADVNGVVSDISFNDIYSGASKLTIGYDYEYFFTQTGGKLGVQLGFAAQYAQGQGRLVIDPSKSSITSS